MADIKICCIKWGDKYAPDYVNFLFDKISESMTEDFDFVCFTDDAEGLKNEVQVKPLNVHDFPERMINHGCWPKLRVFQKSNFEPTDIVLCVDLDVMILNSLKAFTDIVREKKGLHIIREWTPMLSEYLIPLKFRRDRGSNSSIFGFYAGEQDHILDTFFTLGERADKFAGNDQSFINNFCLNKSYWPEPLVKSFRRHSVYIHPLGRIFKPKKPNPNTCHILVFHGTPNPLEIIEPDTKEWGNRSRKGYGPVSWVRDYWAQEN